MQGRWPLDHAIEESRVITTFCTQRIFTTFRVISTFSICLGSYCSWQSCSDGVQHWQKVDSPQLKRLSTSACTSLLLAWLAHPWRLTETSRTSVWPVCHPTPLLQSNKRLYECKFHESSLLFFWNLPTLHPTVPIALQQVTWKLQILPFWEFFRESKSK
jgi:hypothetical protein